MAPAVGSSSVQEYHFFVVVVCPPLLVFLNLGEENRGLLVGV